MSLQNTTISLLLSTSAWVRFGRQYTVPTPPDKIIYVSPFDIVWKTDQKPPSSRIPPTVIADGEWDQTLKPITDDIVYKAFKKRFVEKKPWDETGYVEFLSTGISEHGDRTQTEALKRCKKIDKLYQYIERHGYKPQQQLQREGELVQGLGESIRPPKYREIAVNVTRDGELVWHAGMHRLVIAKLLDIDTVPVRIHVRHTKWQQIRERIYCEQSVGEFENHPDINWFK